MCLEKSCWLQFDELREHHTGSLTRIRTYSMFKHWQYNDFNCAPAEHNTCQIQNEFNINYLLFNIGFGRLTEFVWKTYTRNSEISRPLFLAIFLAHSNLETGRQASDNSRNPTKMRTKDSIIIYNLYFIFFTPFSWISLCARASACSQCERVIFSLSRVWIAPTFFHLFHWRMPIQWKIHGASKCCGPPSRSPRFIWTGDMCCVRLQQFRYHHNRCQVQIKQTFLNRQFRLRFRQNRHRWFLSAHSVCHVTSIFAFHLPSVEIRFLFRILLLLLFCLFACSPNEPSVQINRSIRITNT